MRMPQKRSSGFTLTEMVVVVLVIGVVASVAFVKYFSTVEKIRAEEGKNILNSVMSAAMRYRADHDQCTTTFSQLDINLRSSPYFSTPTLGTPTCPTGGCGGVSAGNGPLCQPTASVQRTGLYTFTLNAINGQITCANVVSGSNYCSKLGY